LDVREVVLETDFELDDDFFDFVLPDASVGKPKREVPNIPATATAKANLSP
jgi:hypothetical protein